MVVRVVTDSSANIPPELAGALGITVLDLHVVPTSNTTSGLSSLELCAAYARQLERGGGEGVVALHLSQEISSTFAAASAAAAVFDGQVEVIDSRTIGMSMGIAALMAAVVARSGGSLKACVDAARRALSRSQTWVYVHAIDDLRKSGRLSTGAAMLSAALLATKPILHVANGRLELVGKTRTQTKAFAKLVDLVAAAAGDKPAFVVIQQYQADAETLRGMLAARLHEASQIIISDMDEALGLHTGPGALGVSGVFAVDNSPAGMGER